MKIVISGLTAAGKTTHGALLAEQLGFRFHSSTLTLAQIVAERSARPVQPRWDPAMDEARLADVGIDEELDQRMVHLLDSPGDAVIDACMLPWVAPSAEHLYVWLDSGLASRVRKCFVSHLEDGVTWGDARARVLSKDRVTVGQLLKSTGHALNPDPRLFHLIVSNGDTIPQPTLACAQEGIEMFAPVFRAAVDYCLGMRSYLPTESQVIQCRPLNA